MTIRSRHECAAVVETVRVDAFAIPHGSSLRQALGHHGWRPTGPQVPGCGWGAILAEPIRRR
jgi:hypothetical protein